MRLVARRGLALPVVLISSALITVALAVTFTMVGGERRVSNNFKSQLVAFSLAEAGLEKCSANRLSCGFATTSPSGTYDSVRITLTGGYADVVFERLRDTTGGRGAIYVVRSTGVQTARGAVTDPLASRTVAELASYTKSSIRLKGAFTTLNGLNMTGGSATLTGDPTTPTTGCTGPTINGVVAPSGGYSGPAVTGGVGYLPSVSARDSIAIDWADILNGSVITPDITIPSGSMPGGSAFHVIKVTGDLTVNPGDSGNGVLIISGNLVVNGNWNWNGLVLVGGAATGHGNQTIEGAILTGLNIKTGGTVSTVTDLGNGTKKIQYNPCMLDSALTHMRTLQVYRNAWTDSYKSY
jgi:hypothetical protein